MEDILFGKFNSDNFLISLILHRMFYSKFYISLVEPVEPIFGNCLENILDLEDSKVPTFLKKCVSRMKKKVTHVIWVCSPLSLLLLVSSFSWISLRTHNY